MSIIQTLIRRSLTFFIFFYTLILLGFLCLRFTTGDLWPLIALLSTFAFYVFLPLLIVVPLTWFHMRRRPRLLLFGVQLIIIIIAISWFGGRLRPSNVVTAQGKSISLITFNTFPQNNHQQAVITWLREQSPDIIILQETPLDMPLQVRQLIDVYPYQAIQSRPNGHIALSRFPIVENEDVAFSRYPWPIQQRLVFEIHGQRIALYNIHLAMPLSDVGRSEWRGLDELLIHYDETIRNSQIRELLAMVARETNPYILAGDFNTSEWSPIYELLDQYLIDAFRATAGGLGATWPAGASEELPAILPPILRLDYVWLSTELRPTQAFVGPNLGSDHLPLTVVIGIS